MTVTQVIPAGQVSRVNTAAAPSVSVIPATKRSVKGGGQIKAQADLCVAAYCRVSTGDESQQTSYTNQKAFYTEYINHHPGWHFGGIYADEAISGTSRAHRAQFNRMMEDAKTGKMDYIVTKSISRFARNTVDTLNCVRELRLLSPPVGIFFEKENIDTLDATGELILTILSALAQDESRSLSDNIRWTFQKKFAAGKPQINLNRMLGYDKGEDGEWVINKKQAEIVRFIFRKYVYGHSANSIAKQANTLGYRTINGKEWRADSVLTILRNEKFVGDLEMQKTITKDFLTHKSCRNTGEAPKYYVKDHHIGIIDRKTWDKAQIMLSGGHGKKTEEKERNKGRAPSVFHNLTCGAAADGKECGEPLIRLTYSAVASGYRDWRSEGFDPTTETEKYRYQFPVWRCRGSFKKSRKTGESAGAAEITENTTKTTEEKNAGRSCQSPLVQECALEQSFMEMLYALKRDCAEHGDESWLAKKFRGAYDTVSKRLRGNSYSIQRMELLDDQIGELEEKLQKTLDKRLAKDLRLQLEEYRKERALLEMEQSETEAMSRNYRFFLECLKELPESNYAGMAMNVNGLDMRGSVSGDRDGKTIAEKQSAVHTRAVRNVAEKGPEAPDYLRFERGIYGTFIRGGVVTGDTVVYTTNFGVKLICTGNSRTLGDFLGFRRCREDGTVEVLDEIWKVNDKSLAYNRRKRKRERKGYGSLRSGNE